MTLKELDKYLDSLNKSAYINNLLYTKKLKITIKLYAII